jgi:hypothetical protein
MKTLLICLFFLISSYHSYSQYQTSFYTKDSILIKLTSISDFAQIQVYNSLNNSVQIIDSLEQALNENTTFLNFEDYNFDGYKDFSIVFPDAGMGVYYVFQIFIYNPQSNQFFNLKIPTYSRGECDMFCDIQVNYKKKIFTSSCRGGAAWHTDVWKFDEKGNLIFVKSLKK